MAPWRAPEQEEVMAPRPRYYKDNDGKWRWMITANNHRRTHASTQGFSRKADAKKNYELMLDMALTNYQFVKTEDGPIYE
jgi:uncharacterized protein YegP (UPF0339 family)